MTNDICHPWYCKSPNQTHPFSISTQPQWWVEMADGTFQPSIIVSVTVGGVYTAASVLVMHILYLYVFHFCWCCMYVHLCW